MPKTRRPRRPTIIKGGPFELKFEGPKAPIRIKPPQRRSGLFRGGVQGVPPSGGDQGMRPFSIDLKPFKRKSKQRDDK